MQMNGDAGGQGRVLSMIGIETWVMRYSDWYAMIDQETLP